MATYVDANVFVHAALHDGRPWRDALRATEQPATSVLALDEMVWAMRRLAGRAAAVENARVLMDNPVLRILPIDAAVGSRAWDLMDEAGLDPRDAIHAACALQHQCTRILSDDPDFDQVGGLERIGVGGPSPSA